MSGVWVPAGAKGAVRSTQARSKRRQINGMNANQGIPRLCPLVEQSEVEQRKVGRWSEANTQTPVASRNEQSGACGT